MNNRFLAKIFIYVLKHPVTQQVQYVGKTNNPRIRQKGHRNLRGTTRCDRWKRELKARGFEPVLEIIEECLPGTNWEERERYWIQYYKNAGCNLMNISSGGCSPPIPNHISENTRKFLRERFLGRPIPPEQRAQISKSLTGKKQSPETVAKRKATINANRIAKGLKPWEFGRDKEGINRYFREYDDRRARTSGRPIVYSPEWTAKRLASFNATVATLTPEQRKQRAAHLNVNPVRYWLGKKRESPSEETREKRRQSMLRTVARKKGIIP